ncbi:MAG: hypothetical protein MO852_07615, partial [Candidatus Devosia euplotis]|nr:hypothetical protein [Candidatus Devosia euplotis]
RSAMLDTLNRPFVTVLRAKGLSENRLDFRRSHAPGARAGRLFVPSIENLDYPLEMALMLMITFMYCIAYLLSDAVYALINPRICLGGQPMTAEPLVAPQAYRQRSPLWFAWRRFPATR